jgi:hypothetical protein
MVLKFFCFWKRQITTQKPTGSLFQFSCENGWAFEVFWINLDQRLFDYDFSPKSPEPAVISEMREC